ncbi:MAG: hypothetical protein U0183_26005 [Polyangiaceae bacterium]
MTPGRDPSNAWSRGATSPFAPAVLLVALLAPRDARAEPAHVSLDYAVEGRGCPTEPELRGLVAARLGADPFVAGAPRSIVVRSRTAPDGAFEIVVSITTDGQGPPPQKTFRGAEPQCAELVQRAALAIALLAEDEPPKDAPPPPAPAKEPPPTPPRKAPEAESTRPVAPPAPPRDEPSARTVAVGVEAFGHVGGAAPSPGPGLGLVGFGRLGRVTLGVEGRFVVPTSGAFDPGRVTTTTLGAGPFVCVGGSRVDVCLPILVGATLGEGSAVAEGRTDTSPFVTVGLRPEVHAIPLGRAELTVFFEGYVAPASTAFAFRSGTAFSSAPVGALLGLSAKIGIF